MITKKLVVLFYYLIISIMKIYWIVPITISAAMKINAMHAAEAQVRSRRHDVSRINKCSMKLKG